MAEKIMDFHFSGPPCERHGPYTFFKTLKFYNKDNEARTLSLGDFFFVRVMHGSDLGIGELHSLWEDKNKDTPCLASVRLYFLPQHTAEGRLAHQGQDETLAGEKLVLHAKNLLQWIVDDRTCWSHGSAANYDKSVDKTANCVIDTTANSFCEAVNSKTDKYVAVLNNCINYAPHKANNCDENSSDKSNRELPENCKAEILNNCTSASNYTIVNENRMKLDCTDGGKEEERNELRREPGHVVGMHGEGGGKREALKETQNGVIKTEEGVERTDDVIKIESNSDRDDSSHGSASIGKENGAGALASSTTLNAIIVKHDAQLESCEERPYCNVMIVSYPQYCRYRTMMKRLEHMKDTWMKNALVQAIGGFSIPMSDTKILFCRSMCEHPHLEDHQYRMDSLALNLKGHPRKRGRPSKNHKDNTNNNFIDSENSDYFELNKQRYISTVKYMNEEGVTVNKAAMGRICKPMLSPPLMRESEFLGAIYKYMRMRCTPIERIPSLGFKQNKEKINLYLFYKLSHRLGGYEQITANRQWKHLYDKLGGNPNNTSSATFTRRHYEKLLLPFELHQKGMSDQLVSLIKKNRKQSSGSESKDDPGENDQLPVGAQTQESAPEDKGNKQRYTDKQTPITNSSEGKKQSVSTSGVETDIENNNSYRIRRQLLSDSSANAESAESLPEVIDIAQQLRKRHLFSATQKYEVVMYHKRYPTASHHNIAAYFTKYWGMSINRRTVADIIQQKDKWRDTDNTSAITSLKTEVTSSSANSSSDSSIATSKNCIKGRSTASMEGCGIAAMVEALYPWYIDTISRDGLMSVTEQIIRDKARTLGVTLNAETAQELNEKLQASCANSSNVSAEIKEEIVQDETMRERIRHDILLRSQAMLHQQQLHMQHALMMEKAGTDSELMATSMLPPSSFHQLEHVLVPDDGVFSTPAPSPSVSRSFHHLHIHKPLDTQAAISIDNKLRTYTKIQSASAGQSNVSAQRSSVIQHTHPPAISHPSKSKLSHIGNSLTLAPTTQGRTLTHSDGVASKSIRNGGVPGSKRPFPFNSSLFVSPPYVPLPTPPPAHNNQPKRYEQPLSKMPHLDLPITAHQSKDRNSALDVFGFKKSPNSVMSGSDAPLNLSMKCSRTSGVAAPLGHLSQQKDMPQPPATSSRPHTLFSPPIPANTERKRAVVIPSPDAATYGSKPFKPQKQQKSPRLHTSFAPNHHSSSSLPSVRSLTSASAAPKRAEALPPGSSVISPGSALPHATPTDASTVATSLASTSLRHSLPLGIPPGFSLLGASPSAVPRMHPALSTMLLPGIPPSIIPPHLLADVVAASQSSLIAPLVASSIGEAARTRSVAGLPGTLPTGLTAARMLHPGLTAAHITAVSVANDSIEACMTPSELMQLLPYAGLYPTDAVGPHKPAK